MADMWFYRALSRLPLNYRAKIMTMAFLGTHIPLIALASYFAFQSAPDMATFFTTVGIVLLATLGGTALTLFVLNELLRPVLKTSRALRSYREQRVLDPLPTTFNDEVGTLMADAEATLRHLEHVRDTLEHLDEATGLMNRRRLVELIDARIAAGSEFTVGVLRVANVARLKEAVDATRIETVMVTVAARLATAVPPDVTLARIGQVEFALLLNLRTDETIYALFAGLAEHCRQEVKFADLTVRPAVCVGVSCYPLDAGTAAELIDHAISAAAGADASQPVAHHAPAKREAAKQRLRMEDELRRAIANDELKLFYQPVIDLAKGRVTGAEALIRWQHPERGMIPPMSFIPVAEASGLIDPIGLWTIRAACEQIAAWNREGRTDLRVAVNLSARQFLDPQLRSHVAEAVTDAAIAPNQLEIELTETAAMTDHDTTRRIFSTLRDLGVTIAIDDFGTGYASMSYLRRLPFDKLKIDREFVTDIHKRRDGQAICAAMITLGHGLGLAVLAEGTETEDEVRFLRDLGCGMFQGYYFARPMPASAYGDTVDALACHALMQPAQPLHPGGRANGASGLLMH